MTHDEMISREICKDMKNDKIKEELRKVRKEKIKAEAKTHYPFGEDYDDDIQLDLRLSFAEGAKWADSHPNGFINEEQYLNRLWERKEITNKEFIELLKQFPDNANVCIECCNPRAMVYDEENNLIRID